MTEKELDQLRFPIGRFVKPTEFDSKVIASGIEDISIFPSKLKTVVGNLTDRQLETRYRPGGWSIRQVVHHCADSHMNGYIRHKLTLTEDRPAIKPYNQALWAELDDNKKVPVLVSIQLLEALHFKWSTLLRTVKDSSISRSYFHAEHLREIPLFESISLYAWHGNHHLGHVLNALQFIDNQTLFTQN